MVFKYKSTGGSKRNPNLQTAARVKKFARFGLFANVLVDAGGLQTPSWW